MSYREEHNEILAKKIYEELKQMPDVCRDYVKYLESLERSYNTIYGYMHDLQTFFYFLTVYNPQINTYKDVTIQILDSLRPTDIQEYMHFLINYKDDKNSNSSKEEALTSWFINIVSHIPDRDRDEGQTNSCND